MVSIRQQEQDGILTVLPVDQIPWESIRSTLQWQLRKRGVEPGRAEELVDSAIVETCAKIPRGSHISTARVRRNCLCELATVQRHEAEQRAMLQPIGDHDDYADSQVERRLSRLSPMKVATAANDAIRLRRETDRLFSWFTQNWFNPEWV